MTKHSPRHVLVSRAVFGSAAALLLGLVGWIAVRAGGGEAATDGTPLMVLPSGVVQAAAEGSLPPLPPVESAVASPSVSVSASSSPSVSPSVSRTASASASADPKPSKSTSKPRVSTSPSRTVSPTPTADVLSATYGTGASWRDGFIAGIQVTNNGGEARDWTVTVTYPSSADVELRGGWNAGVSISGDTVTLRGRSLAPGQSISAGFQAGKRSSDAVKPVSCSIGGGSCRVG